MSFALMEQTAILQADSSAYHGDSLVAKWGRVHTIAAGYAKALTQLGQGALNAAESTVLAMDLGAEPHDRDLEEQARMLQLISFYRDMGTAGKMTTQLESQDISDLQNIIGTSYDRPAGWAQNLLCFGYGLCRPSITGGANAPRNFLQINTTYSGQALQPELKVHPNPASTWTAASINLFTVPVNAQLVVRDGIGRVIASRQVFGTETQELLDVRNYAEGIYQVELLNNGSLLSLQRFVVSK